MKIIINIIFILLLSISLFIFPLNLNLLNFDSLNEPEVTEDQMLEDRKHYVFSLLTDTSSMLISPEYLEMSIDSDEAFGEDLKDKLKFTLNLTATNGETLKFTEKDLKPELEHQEKKLLIKLPLSSDKLKLRYTGYKADLDLVYSKLEEKIRFDLFYSKNQIKLQKREALQEELYTPIYYYDVKHEFRIPVFRPYIDKSHQFANVIYSAIEKEEKLVNYGLEAWKLNLDETRPRVWYNDGLITIDFSTSNVNKIKDKGLAERSLENLSYSLAYANTGYLINAVAYAIVDKEEQSVAGYQLTKPIEIRKNPKIYLPFFYNKSEYFWALIDFESTHTLNEDIRLILDAYAGSHAKLSDNRLISLLPPQPFMNKVHLMDKTLYLDIKPEALKFFETHRDYAALLVEGLVLSLSSLEEVDYVEFSVAGKDLSSLGGHALTKKMSPQAVINILE